MSSVICKDDQGAFIPATQRPDGSWRKPRRIKDGYVPQEEVPLYESKGRQLANQKPQYPPGLHPDLIKKKEMEKAKLNAGPVITYSPTPGVILTQGGPEVKEKKKKKKKKSSGGANDSGETGNSSVAKQPPKKSAESAEKTQKPSTDVPQTDPSKRLKNLRKKLREIEAIEQKIADGQKDKVDKDQLEKVARKPDVLSEIFALELCIEESK